MDAVLWSRIACFVNVINLASLRGISVNQMGPPPWEDDQGGFWVQWGLADGGQPSTDCQWDKNIFDCLTLKKYVLTTRNAISPQDQSLLQIQWTQSVPLTKQVPHFILHPSKISQIIEYMVAHCIPV